MSAGMIKENECCLQKLCKFIPSLLVAVKRFRFNLYVNKTEREIQNKYLPKLLETWLLAQIFVFRAGSQIFNIDRVMTRDFDFGLKLDLQSGYTNWWLLYYYCGSHKLVILIQPDTSDTAATNELVWPI